MEEFFGLIETDPLLFVAFLIIIGYVVCQCFKNTETYQDLIFKDKPDVVKDYEERTQGVYSYEHRM